MMRSNQARLGSYRSNTLYNKTGSIWGTDLYLQKKLVMDL